MCSEKEGSTITRAAWVSTECEDTCPLGMLLTEKGLPNVVRMTLPGENEVLLFPQTSVLTQWAQE